jgi:pimeloyl-ACP methyl ester carboxylesterase
MRLEKVLLNFSRLKKIYFVYVLLIIFFVGCEPEIQQESNDSYLVSYELKSSYSKDQVKTQLALGSLLYSDIAPLINSVQYGVKIYKVTYNTTFLGKPIIASGLISIPNSNNDFPVISFQNGTNTCHENAPSNDSSDPVYSIISFLASNGYILCIPDYIGFGDSDYILHPYMHRNSSDTSIVDLLKSLTEFTAKEDIKPTLNDNLNLIGYSQGAWATLSALEFLENNPLDNFNVTAAACGAGSYDLMDMSKFICEQETYSNPFFMPYFIESRIQNGIINEPLTTFFNAPYSNTIPTLFDGSICHQSLNTQLNDTISALLTNSLIESLESDDQISALKSELKNNCIPAWQTTASIRLFHSNGDNSIPFSQSQTMYNELKMLGVDAEFVYVDSLEH